MSLFRRIGLLLAGAITTSLLVAIPVAPAHADYDLGVTWPDVSQINPNVTDYQITVIDSGPGELYTRWDGGGSFAAIPHTGTVTVDLPYDDTGRVQIWRCVAGTCDWAGVSSPIITVHRYLSSSVYVADNRVTTPSDVSASVVAYPFTGLTDLSYDWALRGPDAIEVLSGSAAMASNTANLTFTVPSELADGTYTLAVTVHGSFLGGSLVNQEVSDSVVIDNSPPVVTVTPAMAVFFPYEDRYRDTLTIHLAADEDVTYAFDLLDENDASVGVPSLSTNSTGPMQDLSWTGRAANKPVPAGTYRLRVTATDVLGHVSTVDSSSFRVDLARKKTITTETVLAPAKVLYDRFVGKCSTLARPSSHRWKDSLGLYSQTKCKTDKKNASVVVVYGAWWLPQSMRGVRSFDRVGIYAYGGAARKARNAYLVMGYIDKFGDFFNRAQFPPTMGWHSVHSVHKQDDFDAWVRYQDGRPYVVWSAGLTAGSRYDIKAFRMWARFDALVEPDGTLVGGPARLGGEPPHSSSRPLLPAGGVAR